MRSGFDKSPLFFPTLCRIVALYRSIFVPKKHTMKGELKVYYEIPKLSIYLDKLGKNVSEEKFYEFIDAMLKQALTLPPVGRIILGTPQSGPSAFVLEYGLHHILR